MGAYAGFQTPTAEVPEAWRTDAGLAALGRLVLRAASGRDAVARAQLTDIMDLLAAAQAGDETAALLLERSAP